MFKFESLEMIGFKSFAEKTRITFHDRISAIVGPNGCGKSNLADAIGWVLGIQGARHLRGEKMEDLIFNGSGKRRQSGVAEVTLTLRRTGSGSIELAGEKFEDEFLEISRKYYRSGEGHYLVNQRRSRLLDLQRFLEEAGLGFSSYAIIAQGRIESFLTSKPLERRALIEEAAQIAGYKSRRRSAELKLEMAQQNLLRISDIISEVERQLRSLKRQAAKARTYRRLKEEFRQVQRRIFALEAARLAQRLHRLDSQLEVLRVEEKEVAEKLRAKEAAAQEAAVQREELETALSRIVQRRSEIRLRMDRAENSIRYQEEQISSTRAYLEQNSIEKNSILKSLDQVACESRQFVAEKEALEAREVKVKTELEQQRDQIESFRRQVGETEETLEELRNALIRVTAQRAALQNQKEQLQERRQRDYATRRRLEQEAAGHTRKLRDLKVLADAKKRQQDQKQKEESELRARIESEQDLRRHLQQKLVELEEESRELQNHLIAFRERLQSLQEVELTRSNYSEGVQEVLKHLARSSDLKTTGTLADFIETSPMFERLVEEFLDEELEYILVDSLEEAARGLSQLRKLKSGKCTFLSLYSSNGFGRLKKDRVREPQHEEGFYGRLADVVEMKPEVAEAFYRVMPDRAEALVVSDVDRAFQLAHSFPESTFITLQGESLTPRGLLSATASEAKNLGLLGLKRQKRELEKKIEAQQRALHKVEDEREKQKAELDALTLISERNRSQLFSLEKECITLGHETESLEADIARQQKAIQVVAGELAQLEQERSRQEETLVGLETRLQEIQSSCARLEEQRLARQEHLEEMRRAFSRQQEHLNGLSSDQKVVQERLVSLVRTLERIRSEEEGLRSRLESNRSAEQQSRQRIHQFSATLAELRQQLERNTAESERLESALAERKATFETFKDEFQALEKDLSELRLRKSECQEARSASEVERARAETQLQNLEEQCLRQLRLPLREAVTGLEPAELIEEEVQSRHQELRSRLESFGPVNMTALQEYQENEERYQFLTRQRHDLEQSITDTTRAIQEINRRSREKFSQAFEAINANFKEVFQKLFGGGECGMQLLEGEDLLECGIDVFAQPPGKKLQNVMLLSGGEKAMTVLALLVGIFLYRPSRFCVLDEVDAPLDDANVRRFSNLVQEMSEKTQFIVITHNKRTMEAANALFGVTMEEAGVSKVVSVEF